MIYFPDGMNLINRERHAPGSEKPPCIQAKKSNESKNGRRLPVFKVILLFIFILFFHSRIYIASEYLSI